MVSMELMNPAYGLYGFSYFWPAWVHLIVVALMVVSGALTLKALAARSAGRSRVYGLGCGFVAGLGNLCLSVTAQAEARHVWHLGTVIAIYAVVAVLVIMSLFMLWSSDSDGFLWSRAFHTFLLVGVVASAALEITRRTLMWIPLPVIGVAVLLALFAAFVVGRNTADYPRLRIRLGPDLVDERGRGRFVLTEGPRALPGYSCFFAASPDAYRASTSSA